MAVRKVIVVLISAGVVLLCTGVGISAAVMGVTGYREADLLDSALRRLRGQDA